MACPKSCISVQSHVVHGYVGNKCAVFPLQLHGFDVSPINSVQFSNHTGYDSFTGDAMDGPALTRLVDGMEKNGLLQASHMLTGYMRNASFLKATFDLLQRARRHNPSLVYVCDPVLGDDGRLYVPEELVGAFSELVTHADLVTPNQFECEALTGVTITSFDDAARACDWFHERGVRAVVITSIALGREDVIFTFCSEDQSVPARNGAPTADAGAPRAVQRRIIEVPRLDAHFTGTGDLAAALLLAWTSEEANNFEGACVKALAALQVVCRRTKQQGRRELDIVGCRRELDNPPDAMLTVRPFPEE